MFTDVKQQRNAKLITSIWKRTTRTQKNTVKRDWLMFAELWLVIIFVSNVSSHKADSSVRHFESYTHAPPSSYTPFSPLDW